MCSLTRFYLKILLIVTNVSLYLRYLSYNKVGLSEEAINDSMRAITQGLYSVLATLGSIPIIRSPANGASEMVARQLTELVVQASAGGSGGPFFESGSTVSSRPLVIILDRALDFASALMHTYYLHFSCSCFFLPC